MLLSKVNCNLRGKKSVIDLSKIVIGDAYCLHYEYQGAYWSLRKFSGVCLSVTGKGTNSRVLLANIINGIRVEYSFFANCPNVMQLEKLGIRKLTKARRGRLLYFGKKKPSLCKV